MQKNLSEEHGTGPVKALKFVLFGFVVLSIAAIAYRTAATPDKTPVAPVEAVTAAADTARPDAKPGAKTPAAENRPAKPSVESKSAVVYYFYTNTRCSSCKTLEAYTREAVSARLAAGYKDWKVEFRAVNVDEKPNEHYVQDYWLNTKSVVVQKYAGDKPLKWGKLDKVWQLLGDKEGFMNYIAVETQKLLDEK